MEENSNSFYSKTLEKDLFDENSFSNQFFICKNCLDVPIISFNTLEYLKYSCSCTNYNCININEIIDNNIINIEIPNEKYLADKIYKIQCLKHKKKFSYYCIDCSQNLCEYCINRSNFHVSHILYYFDKNYFATDKAIEKIKSMEIKDVPENIITKLKKLSTIIYKDYNEYPNYSHFLIFDELSKFFQKNIDKMSNVINSVNKEIKIQTRNELIQNLNSKQNLEFITEIVIRNSNINDITELCKANLINLKILELNHNCILNIKPLKIAKFKKIERLDFGENKLGNDNIPVLFELFFRDLKELNLYLNNFTDCEIFNLRQNKDNMPNLELLFLGSNIFNWKNEKKEDNNKKYDLTSLKLVGLTNGVFDTFSLTFFERFQFYKLEALYISRNDFISLSFVDKLDLPFLKNFSIHTSHINEFEPLKKFKTLEEIDMRDNYIKDINNLFSFIKDLPNLKNFDLSGNDIDKNLEENKSIISRINDKFKIELII